ncbi:hypothetical protein AVEN_38879-1, partial [Araneus ventricosus]
QSVIYLVGVLHAVASVFAGSPHTQSLEDVSVNCKASNERRESFQHRHSIPGQLSSYLRMCSAADLPKVYGKLFFALSSQFKDLFQRRVAWPNFEVRICGLRSVEFLLRVTWQISPQRSSERMNWRRLAL